MTMKVAITYRCRMCGAIYETGDTVTFISVDGKPDNIKFSAPTLEVIVTENEYPPKEVRFPLVAYHRCANSDDLGVADFAGFTRRDE